MNDNKKLSKDTFNLQATTYDIDKNGAHARTLYPHIIDKLSDISFDNVLDVGCGTGEILNTIKNIYPAVSLYGIDISEEMLKKSKEKLLNTAELSLGDAEHLPYEHGKFDLLMCTDSFHHYPNPQKAMEEFHRVLKTDGHILLVDFWKPFPVRQLMNIFIPFSNEGDVKVYSKKEIISFLSYSGFQNIEYQKVNNSSYLVIAKKQ